jgi:hypothetical protein
MEKRTQPLCVRSNCLGRHTHCVAAEADNRILKPWEFHVGADKSRAATCGRDDLDLGHGFHQIKQGKRFTISEPARREVLARLLKLNHERYAEEVAQGLHDKKKSKTAKKGKKAMGGEPETPLFGGVQ